MYKVEHIHLWDKIQVACTSQSYFNRQQFVKIGVLLYCKPRHVHAVHILCISHSVLDAQHFDVNENYNDNRTHKINWHVHEDLTTQICLLEPDALKYLRLQYWEKHHSVVLFFQLLVRNLAQTFLLLVNIFN